MGRVLEETKGGGALFRNDDVGPLLGPGPQYMSHPASLGHYGHGMTRCGLVFSGVLRCKCGVAQCSVELGMVWGVLEWCDVAWRGVVWCGMVWCGVVWCGVVWCGVVWCGVVWCGVVWCGVVWCGVVWCGVVWCGVVWCGVVWCGVVWRGVVWCGVVWCGVGFRICNILSLFHNGVM